MEPAGYGDRTLKVLVVIVMLTAVAQGSARAEVCADSIAGAALDADVERARLANWGWGAVFATSAIVHSTLALNAGHRNTEIALWTGAVKSGVGVLYQVTHPIRLSEAAVDCHDLDLRLRQADQMARDRRGWKVHAMTVGLNLTAFAFVAYQTDDLPLAAAGALMGMVVGELRIQVTPDQVRSGGHATQLQLIPAVSSDGMGVNVGGSF
jgi:hypothetical protein